jgi:ATP-dependent HslUV protease ATP-binding subunit HslU
LADMLKHGGGGRGDMLKHGATEDRVEKEKVKVGDALPRLEEAELEKALEGLDVDAMAVALAEQRGIVFVDEIDKLVRRDGTAASASFSKGEGVQKELLALLEGTTVRTRRGPVSTRHILFICAGAFHQSKPADLLPELQGRLPVRVDLKPVRRPPSIPRAPIRHLAFT